MDPNKKLGIVKEQVQMEHDSRRNFAKNWSKLKDPDLYKFYNQNEINKQLKSVLTLKDLCPYTYTGHGDSYFVSREMYNALVAKCRCERQRSEAHILKCLQKNQDKYQLEEEENDREGNTGKDTKLKRKLPETSNGFFGYVRQPPSYKQWEHSMKYISPIATMPGHRIAAKPYNALFIG